eukprot:403358955
MGQTIQTVSRKIPTLRERAASGIEGIFCVNPRVNAPSQQRAARREERKESANIPAPIFDLEMREILDERQQPQEQEESKVVLGDDNIYILDFKRTYSMRDILSPEASIQFRRLDTISFQLIRNDLENSTISKMFSHWGIIFHLQCHDLESHQSPIMGVHLVPTGIEFFVDNDQNQYNFLVQDATNIRLYDMQKMRTQESAYNLVELFQSSPCLSREYSSLLNSNNCIDFVVDILNQIRYTSRDKSLADLFTQYRAISLLDFADVERQQEAVLLTLQDFFKSFTSRIIDEIEQLVQ